MCDYENGIILFNQKQFDDAISCFIKDSEHKDSYLQIANCLLCKKDYDRALEYIEKSIKKNPNDINNCIIKGLIQYESEEKDIGIKNILKKDLDFFNKIVYAILLCSWLSINYLIYKQYNDFTFITNMSIYFICLQSFVMFIFMFYKFKYFEQLLFLGAMISGLAAVTYPIHGYISWLPLLQQAIWLANIAFSSLLRKDIQYLLLEHIKNYINIENYELALDICNIAIDNAPKDLDLSKYYEYQNIIQEKLNK